MAKFKPLTFTLEQIIEGQEMDWGYCLKCGATREMCEPDARRYPCEDGCGKTVYGAQEILLMGLVNTSEEVAS